MGFGVLVVYINTKATSNKATTSRETHAPKNAHYKKAEGSKHRALGPLNPEPKFEV